MWHGTAVAFFCCWMILHCINIPQCIYLTADGHLGHFQFLAITCGGVTTHIRECVFDARAPAFLLGIHPEVELLGYRVCSALEGTDELLSKVGFTNLLPSEVNENSNCSVFSSTLGICGVFYFSCFGWYVVAFYSFNLNFYNDEQAWPAFHVFLGLLGTLFSEISASSHLLTGQL